MEPSIAEQLKRIENRLNSIETQLRHMSGGDLDGLFMRGRSASRANVISAGLSDSDIDALIKEAREDVARLKQ